MLSLPDNDRPGAHVFNDPRISLRGKQLYGVLMKYVDMNNTCILTPQKLTEEMQVSASGVYRAAKSLETAGAIERYRPDRRKSEIRYRLLR